MTDVFQTVLELSLAELHRHMSRGSDILLANMAAFKGRLLTSMT